MVDVTSLEYGFIVLAGYFQVLIIVLLGVEVWRFFTEGSRTGAGAEAAAGARALGRGAVSGRSIPAREAAAAREERELDELEIKDEQQLLQIFQQIKTNLKIGSSASIQQTLALFNLAAGKLQVLDKLEKKKLDDEKFLKNLRKSKELQVLLGEEKNLVNLVGLLVEKVEEKLGGGTQGNQLVPYIEKIEAILIKLIQLNRREEADER